MDEINSFLHSIFYSGVNAQKLSRLWYRIKVRDGVWVFHQRRRLKLFKNGRLFFCLWQASFSISWARIKSISSPLCPKCRNPLIDVRTRIRFTRTKYEQLSERMKESWVYQSASRYSERLNSATRYRKRNAGTQSEAIWLKGKGQTRNSPLQVHQVNQLAYASAYHFLKYILQPTRFWPVAW